MKYVALRCLEQWVNLKEYFLNFLPKQKNFKSEVSRTQRYARIKVALEEPLTEDLKELYAKKKSLDH